MEYKVFGVEVVDYENKQGRRVKGTKLHLGYEKEGVAGTCVETVFVPERIECNAKVCDSIEVVYNRFGSVAGVKVLA